MELLQSIFCIYGIVAGCVLYIWLVAGYILYILGRSQDSNIKSSILFLLFVAAAVRRKMSEREKYVETYCFVNLDIDLNLNLNL